MWLRKNPACPKVEYDSFFLTVVHTHTKKEENAQVNHVHSKNAPYDLIAMKSKIVEYVLKDRLSFLQFASRFVTPFRFKGLIT